MVLPDVVTLPLIAVGLLNALWSEPVLLDRALGAGIGLVVLPLLNSVYRAIRKRNGIGFGDAKLLVAAGAWLGWMALPYMLLIASMAGLATVLVMMWRQLPAKGGTYRLDAAIPFGPFLAIAFFILFLWQMEPSL